MWAAADGSLTGTVQNGELLLSSGAAYRLVPLYMRPALYAVFAFIVILASFAAMLLASLPDRGRGLLALPKTFR